MIESQNNAQVKNVAKLLKSPKDRKKQRSYIIEGPKMVLEAVREGVVSKVYISETMNNILNGTQWDAEYNNNRLAHMSSKEACGMINGSDHEVVKDNVFAVMCDTVVPQGMVAVASMPVMDIDDIMSASAGKTARRYIVLENLQDPGNLGTIFRTAEAAGFDGVLMNRGTVDVYNPKVVRSTMGAVLRVSHAYCDSIGTIIDKCRNAGISLMGAALDGTDMRQTDYPDGLAVLIGNESNGLSDEALSGCNMKVRIPMAGKTESLNAAVAAGVLMYMSSLSFL